MTQDQAFNILTTGVNVFLTGEPGSGKSHTVNRYVRWLREHRIEPAITASTGIAATHIGGATIHSWSGIGIKRELTSRDLSFIAGKRRVVEHITSANVLIIDEVSMLGANMLTMIELVCRKIRGVPESFGGLQVVLVGDFFQLPPIVSRESREDGQRSLISSINPGAQFAFSSPAWQSLKPVVCYLSEQHRQEDSAFLDFLSALRGGRIDESHRALLRTRARAAVSGATQLFSHNTDVDRLNEVELGQLSDAAKTYTMSVSGVSELVTTLMKGCLTPETLTLKAGAKVMFTKNDPMYRFVNGSLGTVTGFSSVNGYPTVKMLNGRTVVAEPTEWSLEEGGDVLARIIQVPLRLAWAITVHKSQGMSLDAAHMDLSQVFEYGQGYVALSRVRTLAGLTLAGINQRALEVHPEIQQKDLAFREASRQAQENFGELSADEITERQRAFIDHCGGMMAASPVVRKEKKVKKPTLEVTRELVAKKLTPEEMASEREISFNTILEHLEKLISQKKLDPEVDLAYLKPEEKRFEKIKAAFKRTHDQIGTMKLTPTRELLGESFSFEELRVARLFVTTH